MVVDLENTILSSEKIMTVSATEYVASIGEDLNKYLMVGISVNLRNYNGIPRNLIALHAPSGAEVVVNYIDNLNSASGTALIPKQEKNK